MVIEFQKEKAHEFNYSTCNGSCELQKKMRLGPAGAFAQKPTVMNKIFC